MNAKASAAGLFSLVLLPAILLISCATSPMGRKQLMILPEAQVSQMGIQAFDQMKGQTPPDTDPAINSYVRCIINPLTEQAKSQLDVKSWEVVVFKDPQVNAFALPGGKIGVFSGILPVTKTDAQLAAVLAHEIGHVIARHGAERMSQAVALQGGLALSDVAAQGSRGHDLIMGALGLGAQFGAVLPWSRTQEKEADDIGIDLMARAGFDPAQSIELWNNMVAASGNGPPQILSDHPAPQNRIQDLQSRLPDAEAKYRQSTHVSCKRPSGV